MLLTKQKVFYSFLSFFFQKKTKKNSGIKKEQNKNEERIFKYYRKRIYGKWIEIKVFVKMELMGLKIVLHLGLGVHRIQAACQNDSMTSPTLNRLLL